MERYFVFRHFDPPCCWRTPKAENKLVQCFAFNCSSIPRLTSILCLIRKIVSGKISDGRAVRRWLCELSEGTEEPMVVKTFGPSLSIVNITKLMLVQACNWIGTSKYLDRLFYGHVYVRPRRYLNIFGHILATGHCFVLLYTTTFIYIGLLIL